MTVTELGTLGALMGWDGYEPAPALVGAGAVVRFVTLGSLLHSGAGLLVTFEGADEGCLVEVRASDRRCLRSEVHLDTFNAINFLECSLHSGGTPPTSCHAADGERDHGGVTHLVGLPVALAGNEGDAAEPQEEEEELFHGSVVWVGAADARPRWHQSSMAGALSPRENPGF